MSTVLVVVVLVVVLIAVAVAVTNARRRNDGVDSFRRQIDALSPEARRTVVDQVQNAAERRDQLSADDEHGDDEHGDDEHGDDEHGDEHDAKDDGDGPRGT